MKRKISDAVKAGILIGAVIYCAVMSGSVAQAVAAAVERCIYTLVPALYAMLILSTLLVRSGAAAFIGRIADKPARLLFGMSGEELTALAAGAFTGYLTGAKMLCAINAEGRLDRVRGGLLCGVCFGAGPAFISCCAASRLYRSEAVSGLILFSTVSADIVLALMLSPFLRRKKNAGGSRPPVMISSEMLMECTVSAGTSMAEVCFITAAFAIVSQLFIACGAAGLIGSLLKPAAPLSSASANELVMPFFDVTAVSVLPAGDYTLLPLICGYISFGGICVLAQLAAVCRGRFSVLPAVFMRTAAGVLSYVICRTASPYFLRNETVSTAAIKVSTHREVSPVPSVMLMIMTFMLLCSCSGIITKKGRH